MMSVEVIPVTNNRLQKYFIQFPLHVYTRAEQEKITPFKVVQNKFDRQSNPFLNHTVWQSFLVFREGKPVGRITASIDTLFPDKKTGFFGFWENSHDSEAAIALFKAAEIWLLQQGRKEIVGPITFSTHDHLGVLVEGHELDNQFQLSYNPPYYQNLIEGAGYSKLLDLYSYSWSSQQPVSERLMRISSRLKKSNNLLIRPIRYRELESEAEAFLTIYNSSMVNNWGYVPLTSEEARNIINWHRRQVKPEYFLFAEAKGVPVGFCLAIPDFKSGCLRVAVLAARPEYSHLGVSALLISEIIDEAVQGNLHTAELSYIQEQNNVVNNLISQDIGSQIAKRYRLYHKLL